MRAVNVLIGDPWAPSLREVYGGRERTWVANEEISVSKIEGAIEQAKRILEGELEKAKIANVLEKLEEARKQRLKDRK
jgi:hypothetical protein